MILQQSLTLVYLTSNTGTAIKRQDKVTTLGYSTRQLSGQLELRMCALSPRLGGMGRDGREERGGHDGHVNPQCPNRITNKKAHQGPTGDCNCDSGDNLPVFVWNFNAFSDGQKRTRFFMRQVHFYGLRKTSFQVAGRFVTFLRYVYAYV